jgi:hypothetical protein
MKINFLTVNAVFMKYGTITKYMAGYLFHAV